MTQTTTPKVFLLLEPPPVFNRRTGELMPKDLSSANRYGELVTILPSRYSVSDLPGPTMRLLYNALKDFEPSRDFICFSGGDAMALALAMLVLRDMNHRDVRVLKWDRERSLDGERTGVGFYVPVLTPLRMH